MDFILSLESNCYLVTVIDRVMLQLDRFQKYSVSSSLHKTFEFSVICDSKVNLGPAFKKSLG